MNKLLMIIVLLYAIAVTLPVKAQTKGITINGKIISFEESFPLEGVSITVKGTRNNTGTQADGTFTLVISADDKLLLVSHPGYESQEIKISKATQYDIVLRRAAALTMAKPARDVLRNASSIQRLKKAE